MIHYRWFISLVNGSDNSGLAGNSEQEAKKILEYLSEPQNIHELHEQKNVPMHHRIMDVM